MLVLDDAGNPVPLVDLQGRFTAHMGDLAGKYVKNEYYADGEAPERSVDVEIAIRLKEEGKAFRVEKYEHPYPHCWRTDKPVLYYPLDSWFIRSTAAKDRLQELNNTIRWKPASTGTGRFGNWLENLNDWNLSRSRFWGIPLPIWRTEDGKETRVISSVAELREALEQSVAAGHMDANPLAHFRPGDMSEDNYNAVDLHRPYADRWVLTSSAGQPMYREPDLIDVWFDSGAMPYAQLHYPFENKDLVDQNQAFPADFIAEGVDQTRGWFFTLHAIAGMVFDQVAYRSVVSNGLVLDKNGQKMSKRLGNAIDPFTTLEQYGPDAVRWYMISNAQPWDNLKFDLEGVAEVQRKFFGTLANTYAFLALYANIDNYRPGIPVKWEDRPEIDRWILSELQTLILTCTDAFEAYEPTRAARAMQHFTGEYLSNWYVRLSRRRFWKGEAGLDKESAFQTLYTCLETLAVLMAPIAPFYADRLYRDLHTGAGRPVTSVHLADWPAAQQAWVNADLERRMELAQSITSLVLSVRKRDKLKVRQPLARMMVPAADERQRADLLAVQDLILAEVNIKEMVVLEPGDPTLVKQAKPNFKVLGPRYGQAMKAIQEWSRTASQDEIAQYEQHGRLELQLGGQAVVLEVGDLDVLAQDVPGWTIASEGGLTVALDLGLTDALVLEGKARELVNRIQNLRKDSGLEVTDRIVVRMAPAAGVDELLKSHGDYIARETLALHILQDTAATGTTVDIDGINMTINLQKA
jgi:isoleucyl-tRNA synthetase